MSSCTCLFFLSDKQWQWSPVQVLHCVSGQRSGKLKPLTGVMNHGKNNPVWWTDDSKIKRMALSSRMRHLFIWRLSLLLLLSWKGGHSQCFETLQTSKEQSISAQTHTHTHHTHTHTHTDIVLFFRLRPLPFYVYLFLLYSCFIEFVIVASLFPRQSRAERRPSRVNFIWTSQWICVHVCLNHSDVCFHFISVSLSFHFRSEILNVPGFKKQQHLIDQDPARALISV